jgi:hypothetical protein
MTVAMIAGRRYRQSIMEATNLDNIYGSPLLDWTRVEARLVAARWAAEGWPARVDDTGHALTAEYSAPSAGPPPWFVYRFSAHAATAVGTVEPGGATRWRF